MCIKEKSEEEGLGLAHERLSTREALGPVSTMTNKQTDRQTNKVKERVGK